MNHADISIEKVLHALGDPTRRRILELLTDRPYSVSHLARPLGITLTAVGQHLQILEESGLVLTEKFGRVRLCHIDITGLNVLEQWIRDRRSIWEKRLDELTRLLDEM